MKDAVPAIIPEPITRDLRGLPALLVEAGYVPLRVTAEDSFGNFAVTYEGPRGIVQIARDRGQFIVSGPSQKELEKFGLWRTFAGARALEQPLKQWLGTNEA
jgi:hypothetical protein